MLNYSSVITEEEIQELACLANSVWHEYFARLLSTEQIEYMLKKFLSASALKIAIEKNGDEYYLVREDGADVGFLGVRNEGNRLFLSKIYLCAAARGKGYASKMFEFVLDKYRATGVGEIYLTCNKRNTHSLDVYAHWGFERTGSVVTDIGKGYVMDDYILARKL